MAFSMNDIKKDNTTRRSNIIECYQSVKNNTTLTSNTKIALKKYCDYRFKCRNNSRFDKDNLNLMIKELLENICQKTYSEIKLSDVRKFENEIIYQVKKAIYHGATKNLYFEDNKFLNIDVINNTEYLIEKPRKEMTNEETINYFKDLMV